MLCEVGSYSVFVECSDPNPCYVCARGTSGFIMLSIRYSVIFDGVQSCIMGP